MFGTGTFASAPFASQSSTTAYVSPTGVNAVAYLGQAAVTEYVYPAGVAAIGDTGVVDVLIGVAFLVSGVEGLGRVTSPLVWGEINSTSVVNWVEIPT